MCFKAFNVRITRKGHLYMEYYLIMLGIILIDQYTKILVANQAAMIGHKEIIHNFLYITYVENTGAAWSMLSGKQGFLITISILEIGLLVYFFLDFKHKKNKLGATSLALMIAGAIGNLIDRVQLNYVRDFIETYPFNRPFPVFNVADMALTIGVILLAICIILEDKQKEA